MINKNTKIVWFLGMSGAGKTSLAKALEDYLIKNGESAILLDGDQVRSTIHKKLSFSKEDIHRNNIQIAQHVIELKGKYSYIIVSVITPFNDTRSIIRNMLNSDLYFIYVKAPVKELIRRDTKGLYRKSLEGKLNLIGMSDELPFEEPNYTDLVIDTHLCALDESLGNVASLLQI